MAQPRSQLRKRVYLTWPSLELPGSAMLNVFCRVWDAYGRTDNSVDVLESTHAATNILFPVHGEWFVELSARLIWGPSGWYVELPVLAIPSGEEPFSPEITVAQLSTTIDDWNIVGPA